MLDRGGAGRDRGGGRWAAVRPAGGGLPAVKLRVGGSAERSIRPTPAGAESREEMLDAATVKPKLPRKGGAGQN